MRVYLLISMLALGLTACGGGDTDTSSSLNSDSGDDSLVESSSNWGPMKVVKKCRKKRCESFSSKVDGYLRQVVTDSSANIYALVESDGFPHGVPVDFTSSTTNVLISKFSPSGEWIWTRVYGSRASDYLSDAVSNDSGIFFASESQCGFLMSPSDTSYCGGTRAFVVNVGFDGEINWQTSLGPTDGSLTNVKRLLLDSDKIYFVGTSNASLDGGIVQGTQDAYVAKMTVAGTLSAVKSFGTSKLDMSYDITKHESGDFKVSAVRDIGTSGTDYQISEHRFDNLLNLQASTDTQTLNSGAQYNAVVSGWMLVQREAYDSAGNRFVASVSGAVATVTKYDSLGGQVWQSLFDFSTTTPTVTHLVLGGLTVSPTGNIIFGLTTDYATTRDSNGLMMPSYISILSSDGQVLKGINW